MLGQCVHRGEWEQHWVGGWWQQLKRRSGMTNHRVQSGCDIHVYPQWVNIPVQGLYVH